MKLGRGVHDEGSIFGDWLVQGPARQEQKALASTCKVCGNKTEIVMRVPSVGKRYMARLCCEKSQKA